MHPYRLRKRYFFLLNFYIYFHLFKTPEQSQTPPGTNPQKRSPSELPGWSHQFFFQEARRHDLAHPRAERPPQKRHRFGPSKNSYTLREGRWSTTMQIFHLHHIAANQILEVVSWTDSYGPRTRSTQKTQTNQMFAFFNQLIWLNLTRKGPGVGILRWNFVLEVGDFLLTAASSWSLTSAGSHSISCFHAATKKIMVQMVVSWWFTMGQSKQSP